MRLGGRVQGAADCISHPALDFLLRHFRYSGFWRHKSIRMTNTSPLAKAILEENVWRATPKTHKSVRPYAIAIGQAALAWNDLIESLGDVFCAINSAPTVVSMAIWASIGNDRTQIKMLKAAAEAVAIVKTFNLYGEVEWITKESFALADARDTIVHSPLISLTNTKDENISRVEPAISRGHRRARQLLNKDLLSEFKWCRDTARRLAWYSAWLSIALSYKESALPDRPLLPNRGQRKTPRRQNRPRKAGHALRPRSSRA